MYKYQHNDTRVPDIRAVKKGRRRLADIKLSAAAKMSAYAGLKRRLEKSRLSKN